MAVDVSQQNLIQTQNEARESLSIEGLPNLSLSEPNLALIDYSDGVWASDSFTSTCAAIKDRYIRTKNRFKKFTSADILACIKFENTDDDDSKRTQKRNRRVRFSTGMSISVDSLVQYNNEHQSDSKEEKRSVPRDVKERQFLEATFLNVPPHRHLTAGENKIYNAYFEDLKTVGYGRRRVNLFTSYNNPFDPRLKFNGLHNELTIASVATEYGDHRHPHIDSLHGALAVLQDPADFINAYVISYQNYLKSLESPVRVSADRESEILEESESSINVQDGAEVDAEETKLLQKLESARSLWSADEREVNKMTENSNEAQEAGGVINVTPLEIDIESISEALNSMHLGLDDPPTLTSTPKSQHVTSKARGDGKLIVHTTCLSSDGHSTETMIHETILKPKLVEPSVRNPHHRCERNTAQQYLFNADPFNTVQLGSVEKDSKSTGSCKNDGDGTSTPDEGEPDGKAEAVKRSLNEPKVILQRGQFHAAFGYENQKLGSPVQLDSCLMIDASDIDRLKAMPSSEPKKKITLRATTEPFIPTSQKIIDHPSITPVITCADIGATAKQTTAPTNIGPIYQTSSMINKPTISTTGSSKFPPGFVYSYRQPQPERQPSGPFLQPPVQQVQPSEPFRQQPNEQHQSSEPFLQQPGKQQPFQHNQQDNHQQQSSETFVDQLNQQHQHPDTYALKCQQVSYMQSQANLPQTAVNRQRGPPHGLRQEQQHQQSLPYQYHDDLSHRCPNLQETLQNVQISSNARQQPTSQYLHQSLTKPPNYYPQRSVGRGSHIPMRLSNAHQHHSSGIRNVRGKIRNQIRQPASNGNQWIPHANSLQGQPSNSQPLYNSFWLQFQNTNNPNIQHSIHVPGPHEGFVPNDLSPVLPLESTHQYGFPLNTEPQRPVQKNTNAFEQPMFQQQNSHHLLSDNQFIRPSNPFTTMNHRVHQPSVKSANDGSPESFSGAGNPYFSNQTFDANINNNASDKGDADDEQDCVEDIVIGTADDKEGMDEFSIDVLENSRSREKCRATKKRSRPIRSCLVQVI